MLIPIIVLGFLHPFLHGAYAAPQEVSYPTADGFRIYATYYRPDLPSARAVLILPDAKEGRQRWSGVADSLCRAGFHVLVPDLRGTAESLYQRGIRRERARFSASELTLDGLDAQAGVRYLRELPATTIRAAALIGSGGAGTAVMRGRTGDLDQVARVLISPTPETWSEADSDLAGPLLIVVENDDILGLEAAASFVSRNRGEEFWLVDGMGRGAELLTARGDLIRLCITWIEHSLGVP